MLGTSQTRPRVLCIVPGEEPTGVCWSDHEHETTVHAGASLVGQRFDVVKLRVPVDSKLARWLVAEVLPRLAEPVGPGEEPAPVASTSKTEPPSG